MSESDVTEAVNLFLMTKFDQCFKECNDIIKAVKCEPEQERNHKLIEAATALGIQALAETDMWHRVVTFITDVYGTMDMCPPSIIQLCILLHAQVKEYLPCHQIVEIWLRNPYNQKSKKYIQVIRTYAYHILCPAGSYNILKELAEKCDSLTESERTALLQISQTKRYEESKYLGSETICRTPPDAPNNNVLEAASGNTEVNYCNNNITTVSRICEQTNADSERNENSVTNSRNKSFPRIVDLPTLQAVLKWLYESILIKVKNVRHSRFAILLMGALAMWALIQTQSGETVSSLGRLVITWRVFLQKLRLLTRK
ncbi:hypothetical protein BsWGS_12013 [Bradybaena similaris]